MDLEKREIPSVDRIDYDRKGYAVVRGVFNAIEVARFRAEAERLLASDYVDPNNFRTRPQTTPDGRMLVERFDPVVDISELFHDVANDERILGALEQAYGEPFRLFKDKLIFKLPGAAGYTMHQDFTYWQPFPRPLVSVSVAIDGAEAENGALEVFAGYHHKMISPPGELRNMNAEEEASIDPASRELATTQAGDIIIFDCLTPHKSAPNTSDRPRRQLFLTYSAARHGDLAAAHAEHYQTYIRAAQSDDQKSKLYFR
jgi:ectoine hydroxylase-related dioxygenase (phytanoyl-CoA dioxygenase family)